MDLPIHANCTAEPLDDKKDFFYHFDERWSSFTMTNLYVKGSSAGGSLLVDDYLSITLRSSA